MSDLLNQWRQGAESESADEVKVVKDSNGNVLQDGDSVTVIKDLKVKSIRLVDGDHDIDCKKLPS